MIFSERKRIRGRVRRRKTEIRNWRTNEIRARNVVKTREMCERERERNMERRRMRGISILCKLDFGTHCTSVLLSGEEERRGAQEPLSSDSDQTEALALLSRCQRLSDVHFMHNCDITDQNWEISPFSSLSDHEEWNCNLSRRLSN
jgi:hypothetical protein